MSRARLLVLTGATALLVSGCVTKSEFEAHVAAYDALLLDYNMLEDELQTWADSAEAWSQRTYGVICDIVSANSAPQTPYAATTTAYCPDGMGNDGNGVPPQPDDFGAD